MKISMYLVLLILSTSVAIGQKVSIKDNANHILMEVNDEGTTGSISLLPSLSPFNIENKLYNFGGHLHWNGAKLGTIFEAGGWKVNGLDLHPANLSSKIGIGTTKPVKMLEVHFQTDSTHALDPVALFRTTGDIPSVGAIQLQNSDDNYYSFGITQHPENAFGIAYNSTISLSTDLFTLMPDGDLGLGTISPGARLHLEGNSSENVSIFLNNEEEAGLERFLFGTNPGSDAGMIVFGQSHSTYPGKYRFLNNNPGGNFDWVTDSEIKMTLANHGDLGLGTSAPAYKIDVFNEDPCGLRTKSDDDSFVILDKGDAADNAFLSLQTGGVEKWLVGNWESEEDFVIRNPQTSDSSDNAVVIDAQTGAIGLNTDNVYHGALIGLHPDNDFPIGIYMTSQRTQYVFNYYGGYFDFDNQYNGESRTWGMYVRVSKGHESSRNVYGIESYCDDKQSGTDFRYIYGLKGHANVDYIQGTSNAYGVTGTVTGSYDEGYGVYFSGGLGGTGTKSAIVRTDDGPKEVYCQESPENWFEDFGSGMINGGQAVVEVPADFMQTVTINQHHPMKVFITPNANLGTWWVEKGTTAFTVHAPDAEEEAAFDFRIVAKRKGYEDLRLRKASAAYTDHLLYSDIQDVPVEYRAEWVRLVPQEDRDPAWKDELTKAESESLYPEEHPGL